MDIVGAEFGQRWVRGFEGGAEDTEFAETGLLTCAGDVLELAVEVEAVLGEGAGAGGGGVGA